MKQYQGDMIIAFLVMQLAQQSHNYVAAIVLGLSSILFGFTAICRFVKEEKK